MSVPPLLLAMGRRCEMNITRDGDKVSIELREGGAFLCRFAMPPAEADLFAGHITAVATEILNDQRKERAA